MADPASAGPSSAGGTGGTGGTGDEQQKQQGGERRFGGRDRRGGDRGGGGGGGRGRKTKDRSDPLKDWVPTTKLGRLVESGSITTFEQIYHFSMPIKEWQIVDALCKRNESTLKDEVLKNYACAKANSFWTTDAI